MRLSTAFRYEQSINNLQQRQQELSTAQTQLTSGKRVNAASDDPTAAARAERALASIARADADQRAVDASRNAMTLAESGLGNAIDLMRVWTDEAPQVIYLDPMFPHRDKAALVKKEMRLFRPLAGDDDDAPALLEAALALATHRVVVKRPRKAPTIAGVQPGYALEGKSSRFDIYPKKSLKARAD